MTVPKYNELYKPLLEVLADGKPHSQRELTNIIGEKLSLSEDDLADKIPSGISKVYHRIGWASFDLIKANLVERVARGVVHITEFGKSKLFEIPQNVDRSFLIQKKWGRFGATDVKPSDSEVILPSEETPEEQIDRAIIELGESLAEEVLGQLKKLSPASFERFVVELLKSMDYGIGEVTGRTGDGGIDGVIYEDRLRLDRIYLQAKRWADQSVGAPDVNGFIGALARQGATRGVFVTTSRYTQDAQKAVADVRNMNIKLIDGMELAKLAIEYNVGVSIKRKLEMKRLNLDYFEEFEE